MSSTQRELPRNCIEKSSRCRNYRKYPVRQPRNDTQRFIQIRIWPDRAKFDEINHTSTICFQISAYIHNHSSSRTRSYISRRAKWQPLYFLKGLSSFLVSVALCSCFVLLNYRHGHLYGASHETIHPLLFLLLLKALLSRIQISLSKGETLRSLHGFLAGSCLK